MLNVRSIKLVGANFRINISGVSVQGGVRQLGNWLRVFEKGQICLKSSWMEQLGGVSGTDRLKLQAYKYSANQECIQHKCIKK
jgi:hypothetical protein